MLLSAVTDLCRDFIQDLRTLYRCDDAVLVRFLNQALLEVKRLRPDLYISSGGVVTTYTTGDLDTVNFPIDETYVMPVVEFIVGMVEMTDDEFAVDSRAVAFLTVFRQALLGDGNGA